MTLDVRHKISGVGKEDIPSISFLLLVTLHCISPILCQQLQIGFGCCCCFYCAINSPNKRMLHKLDIFTASSASVFDNRWAWCELRNRQIITLRCCCTLAGCPVIWIILNIGRTQKKRVKRKRALTTHISRPLHQVMKIPKSNHVIHSRL